MRYISYDDITVFGEREGTHDRTVLLVAHAHVCDIQHIITYPISHGKYLNWIGFVTIPGGEGTTYPKKWVIDSTQEEVTAHFSGWEPEVDQMLKVRPPTGLARSAQTHDSCCI